MELRKLGQITSPVGIKGEVRVYPYFDISLFSDVKRILIEGETEYRDLEHFRQDKNMIVLKLSGVNDRNTSESLRNKYLVLPKEEMFELPSDTYFYDDLIGMSVFDENNNLVGTLIDINQNSKQDIYIVDTGSKTFMLPAVEEFILSVDTDNKKMLVKLIDGIVDL